MKKTKYIAALGVFLLICLAFLLLQRHLAAREQLMRQHFEQEATELIISNRVDAQVALYRAGNSLSDTMRVRDFDGVSMWLPRGNYFLRSRVGQHTLHIPVPLSGFQSGPDRSGTFGVTLRPPPEIYPPRLLANAAEYVFIPGGSFLFGDRFNPREPHYVWLSRYFICPFEVTNAEFREFVNDSLGYNNDAHWTPNGRSWKHANTSQATARLQPEAPDYLRFGQADQPVLWVNWFEAQAYCQWLTQKIGNGRWLFALPTEAEWEKAARGPDSFQYGLGNLLSDAEVSWYNWKKNPAAQVTVVGVAATRQAYAPNRYGIFHMTGNVVEWTQSLHLPFNKNHPYLDHDRERNDPTKAGLRVARGGSWYSASVALLQISYREAFQPEHSTQDIGFRLVARMLP